MTTISKYRNGNAEIEMLDDGTRFISYDGDNLDLEYPLNIDVRVSSKCAFGLNPKTGRSICDFCHESARTDGETGNLAMLTEKIDELPFGVEIAIGANQVDGNFRWLLQHLQGRIVNLTINQGHLWRDREHISKAIESKHVRGLGVSYRKGMAPIPPAILEYPNTVVHVIAGIDEIHDVYRLAEDGVKKILVLGEKDFGFNKGRVDLESHKHLMWRMFVRRLFDLFEVVSFDNLAIEQLRVGRFINQETWNMFYQGEYSMYINAVDGTFSPSSRSPEKTPWADISIRDYFQHLQNSN